MLRSFCFFLLLTASNAFALGVDPEKNSITIAIANEPPTMNSSQVADGTSNFVLGHMMEGLVRYTRRGDVRPHQQLPLRLSGRTMEWVRGLVDARRKYRQDPANRTGLKLIR